MTDNGGKSPRRRDKTPSSGYFNCEAVKVDTTLWRGGIHDVTHATFVATT